MAKIQVGEFIVPRKLDTISASRVDIPSAQQITHLQFRRFAACPICNLHLQEFIARHLELVANGIQAVVVFHSTPEEMLKHGGHVPFAMIADPGKTLYKSFGVESSLLSILNPAAWSAGIKGIMKFKAMPYEAGQSLLGLPADFLISRTGELVAVKYGAHADDHWSLDEVVQMARQFAV